MQQADLRVRLTWLTLFRTVATTLLLVVIAVRFGSRSDQSEQLGAAALASFGIIATVYVLTLVTALLLRRGLGDRRAAWAHVAFDLALAPSVVFLSGGSDSPFTFLFSLAIIGASVLLGRRGAVVGAAGSALGYGAVAVVTWAGRASVNPGQLVLEVSTQLLAQFLIAVLSGYVAEQLSTAGGRLSEREQDLRALTELQNRVVGAMPSGLVTCEQGGRITFVNPAARAILGLGDQVQVDVEQLLPGVLKLRQSRRAELTVPTPRGDRTLGLTITPLQGDDARSLLIVFQDLTELRRMQHELDRLDRLAELGRLSAQLAHEVRNPLASMRGAAQMLVGDTAGTPQERLARLIVTESDRLAGLVEGYLRLARPPPPSRVRARVDRVAADTLEMLRADPALGRLVIEEDLHEAEALVDVDQLKQVLINLLRNAVAAAGVQGRARVHVERKNGPAGAQVVVDIWDSAGSLAPEDRERIFEPFFTRREGGTGLGLATAQAIVHAHEGTISVESHPSTGTTFSIKMPAVEAA